VRPLAEHFSDVFGILVKQYWLKQSVTQSDWLIGGSVDEPRERIASAR
jgi:Zn-dependent metalloprotease